MVALDSANALALASHAHFLSRPGPSVEGIADAVVGLHATTPVGPYLSVQARTDGFVREALDAQMWDAWQLVRFRAMRRTMFIMPCELLQIAAAATRHLAAAAGERWLDEVGLTRAEFAYWADAVDAVLGDGPLTVRALRTAVGAPPELPLSGIVGRMCDEGRLVGGRPPRRWTSPVRCYHRWGDVLGDVDLSAWSERDAIRALVARYVASYGPLTIGDIAWWTGLTKSRCREALDALSSEVEAVDVDGWPGPQYAARPSGHAEPSGIRVLPMLDPYVQGYRDRARFLDPALHDFVYDAGGNSAATVICAGRIIGVWQFTDAPRILYHLFPPAPSSIRGHVAQELHRTAVLVHGRQLDIEAVNEMSSLRAEGGRSAAHPLDGRRHRLRRPASA